MHRLLILPCLALFSCGRNRRYGAILLQGVSGETGVTGRFNCRALLVLRAILKYHADPMGTELMPRIRLTTYCNEFSR